jgi:hypothetical protein
MDSVVLYDRSTSISVTITEFPVNRWRYPTVGVLGVLTSPNQPEDWTNWTNTTKNWKYSGTAYEFVYTGVKNDIDYVNIVHWHLWGEVNVQVSADIPKDLWDAEDDRLFNELQDVLESFNPHSGDGFFVESDVLSVLYGRMDDRDSTIYGRDETIPARVELSCRDIFTNLLQRPIYLGDGVWQAAAQTLEGTEFWHIFEPNGFIQAQQSNQSVC